MKFTFLLTGSNGVLSKSKSRRCVTYFCKSAKLFLSVKSVAGFFAFELHKFGIFWNLHQSKGVPTPHFSLTYRFLGGAHPSLFINLKIFRVPRPYFSSTYRILGGCPPFTFHQPKSFQGAPTTYFSSTFRILGGAHPSLL
jgi:hypothetical protein